MNPEVFSGWLLRQGYHVVRTDSSYWFNVGPQVFQAFPYHWVISPAPGELAQLWQRGAIALRYSAPYGVSQGVASYHVVYTSPEYLLDQLPKKARHDVRKGLANFSIHPVPLRRLAEEGWTCRLETLARQGRVAAEDPNWWRRLCTSAADLSGFEAWAAERNGKIEASLLTCVVDDCASILYQQSNNRYLRLGVNNALTFRVTQELLQRPEINWVFYGLQSLDAPDSVDAYKFRMRYSARPVQQHVVFHPWLAPFIGSMAHGIVQALLRLKPGQVSLSKLEGMLRFYLSGRRPLTQQMIPAALEEFPEVKYGIFPSPAD